MQKRLLRWELIGFAFTGAVGTLLHFVYEWTGGNPLIAAFCAVNESTWEHMKLLFVPFFLFTMVEFIVFAEPLRSFFAAKAASILLGLLAIPVLFYSLGGMFGKTPDWVNIAIFFLADALLYLMSFRLLTRGALRGGARQTLTQDDLPGDCLPLTGPNAKYTVAADLQGEDGAVYHAQYIFIFRTDDSEA